MHLLLRGLRRVLAFVRAELRLIRAHVRRERILCRFVAAGPAILAALPHLARPGVGLFVKVVHREQTRTLVAVIDEDFAMIGGVVQELGC